VGGVWGEVTYGDFMRTQKRDPRRPHLPELASTESVDRDAVSDSAEPRHQFADGLHARWQRLRQAVPGDRARIWTWFARLARPEARIAAAVAAVTTVTVLWLASRLLSDDSLGQRTASCLELFAAESWDEASVLCAREAERTGQSELGVRSASALVRLDRLEDARAAAERWFGSTDDAMARQVAGEALLRLGERTRALPLLQQALAGHIQRGDDAGAADVEKLLAGVHQRDGRLGDALDAAERAVRYADVAAGSAVDRRRSGRARLVLGKILAEVGDFDRAHITLMTAQHMLTGSAGDQSWASKELAMLAQAMDDAAGAATLFEQTLEQATKGNLPALVTSARLNLARLRCELGDLDAAERHMTHVDASARGTPSALLVEALIAAGRGHNDVAEQLLRDIATRAPTPDYAMDISVQRGRLAEAAADLAGAEEHYRAAMTIVEELRSNTDSLELRPWILASRRIPYRALLSLLIRQRRHLDALVVAEHLHARTWRDALVGRTIRAMLASDPGQGGAAAGGLRAHLNTALSLGRRLNADARDSLSADQLLPLLRGREILVFAELDTDIWRFHVVDGAIARIDRLPDRSRELAERWNRNLNDLILAADLGELLIPPAARASSSRPLYIVSNGVLGRLPFAALRIAGRYLVQDRILARLPGIAALRCRPDHQIQPSRVFFGDSRNDLPHAREEATTLASSLAGTAFVGQDATIGQLEANRNVELLHLAIHAELDLTGARLLLADHEQVTLAEIIERNIGPRVAVLAGCNTARSNDAEGWSELSSAFLAAGSRSVVGTLRTVADRDAREIMHHFYKLDGARQPALALAKAQRMVMSSNLNAWAPFIVHGSAAADDCDAESR
jgi:tetratricopeptide (TPR) repeat protein